MRMIDAHMHYWPGNPHFQKIAQDAGHEISETHLREQFQTHGYVGGVVMGNRGLTLEEHSYMDCLRYCIGVSFRQQASLSMHEMAAAVEKHLRTAQCAGIKLYPGYDPMYVGDAAYQPFYELAAQHQKPVAIHMGLTASVQAYLKYAHPLTLDEVAVQHPSVQFVMCHFGNPFLADAAAVLQKNPNVAADLSGLFEGRLDVDAMLSQSGGYIAYLRTWMAFVGNYEKFLYGTDWPLVNLQEYARLIAGIVPETHHEAVFFANAKRIYGFGDVNESTI